MPDGLDSLRSITVPDKPALEGLETKWTARWESEGVYRFDRTRPRAEVFSVDTPPPTVSGSLHVGHVFWYTHTDVVARFQRMRGKAVFYPMGWDDNGLPPSAASRTISACGAIRPCRTTRRSSPPEKPPQAADPGVPPELHRALCPADGRRREGLRGSLANTRAVGRLVMTYATIDRRAQRVSQLAFLRLLSRGLAYQLEAPTLWDVDFRTAVAQAELEDREQPGAYHRIRFARPDGGRHVEIETTRPGADPGVRGARRAPGRRALPAAVRHARSSRRYSA